MTDTPNPSEESRQVEQAAPEPTAEPKSATAADVKNDNLVAAVGYVPFLCFLPLMSRKDNEFLAFHGRQGLVVTLLCVAMAVISPIVSFVIPILGVLTVFALDLILLAVMIMGAYKAYQGEKWELPVVGKLAQTLKF